MQSDESNPDLIEGLPIKKLFESMSAMAGAPSEADSPSPGATLGGYEIEEEIDRGGMGVVYKARQPGVKRTVAIKVLRSGGMAGEEELVRFESEAELLGRLDHPNIVPVYDVGESEGQPYFAMKYFEGGSLVEREVDFVGDEKRTVDLMVKLSNAIAEVHRRGIIHRDLKPSNILLDGDGNPHISDFGLSRLVEDDSQMTMTGSVMGSPNYISPELAAGESNMVTTAVDVYGLGAILYHCLTGRPPFEGNTPLEVLRKVTDGEPVRPTTHRSEVDRDLETICLKCLEREPGRRYSSARDLGEDLRRWQNGEPIEARPATGLERAVKWTRRYPWRAGMAAVLGFGAIIFVFTNLSYQRSLEESRDEALTAREHAEEVAAELEQSVSRLRLERADMEIANGRQREGMRLLLELLREDAGNRVAAVRLAHEWKRRAFPLPVFPAISHQRAAYRAVYSRDGSRFAAAVADGGLRVWNAETGEPVGEPIVHPELVEKLDLSEDGSVLLAMSESGVYLWNVSTGENILEWKVTARLRQDALLLPDASGFLVATAKNVKLRDGETGEEIFKLPLSSPVKKNGMQLDSATGTLIVAQQKKLSWWDWSARKQLAEIEMETFTNIAFSADGTRFLTKSPGKQWQLWDAREREPLGTPFTKNLVIEEAQLNEDGSRLVLALAGGRIEVVDPLTGAEVVEAIRESGNMMEISFRPGFDQFVAAATSGDVSVYSFSNSENRKTTDEPFISTRNRFSSDWKMRMQRSNLQYGGSYSIPGKRTDLPGEWKVWDFHFHPDGSEVAVVLADGGTHEVVVLDSETLGIEKRFPGKRGRQFVEYSPDGKWLVMTGENEGLVVWNCETGAVQCENPDAPGAWEFSFHPDGMSILIAEGRSVLGQWSLEDGSRIGEVLRFGDMPFTNSAVGQDGKRLLTGGSDMRFCWWELGEGAPKQLGESQFAGYVMWVEFSPRGEEFFLAGARDGKVRVWDNRTGKQLCEIVASEVTITLATFTPDGRNILTVAMDGTARFWDAATGLPVTSPVRHDEWWDLPDVEWPVSDEWIEEKSRGIGPR